MNRSLLLILTALFFGSCSKNSSPDFSAVRLQCNNLENPCGVEKNPALSWIIASSTRGTSQTAYQIILDNVANNLKSESNCLWNSGKIPSAQSAWIYYYGPELKSGRTYYWKVRLWDNNDNPSEWSRSAFFITGLFEKADWDNAKWIGCEEIPD